MFDPFSILINLILGVVLSVAGTLLQQAFGSKEEQERRTGTRGSTQIGGKVPQYFLVGTVGEPGKLEYQNAWGNDGQVPNAYLTSVTSFGDLPVTAMSGLYVNGVRVTLSGAGAVPQGYPVPELSNKFWWKFFDGRQLVADGYLIDKFGGDADRAWASDMVGIGVPYLITTALWDENLWTSFPSVLGEFQGIPLYDPRKDSTAGGVGAQRWANPATWAFSDNNAVIIYNIERGIYYNGAHVWGGKKTAAEMPYAVWAAAMDACDEAVALDAGGTEKRFRAGRRINLNERPADVIKELLIGCNGRISHASDGLVFILVGVPAVADGAFSDADVLATEPLGSIPWPNLDEIINGATATYREPLQAWEDKETAPYLRSDLVEADDGRENIEGLDLGTTFSGTQAQRVIKAVIEEGRRFDTHVVALPPEFAQFRPLQVLAWTSDRFGYSAKLFLITARTREPFGNVVFGLQEIDPTDHDWNPSTDEKPLSFAPVVTNRPAPQEVSGFFVEPAIAYDSEGRPRRPAIDVFWSGASVTVDVRAVRITVALPDEADEDEPGTLVWDSEAPRPELGSARLVEALLPNQAYLVQIQYTPHSGRATVESGWLAVTTPDVRYTSLDIEIDEIRDEVLESVGELDRETRINVRDLIEDKRSQILLAVQGQLADYSDRQLIRRALVAQDGANRAEYKEDILVATGPGSAIVTRIEELRAEVFDPDTGLPATAEAVSLLSAEVHNPDTGLEALANMVDLLSVSYGDVSADGLLSVEVGIAPSGVSSRAILSTRATAGGAVASAAMMLDSRIISGTLTSEVLLVGGRISLVASTSPTATKRGMLVVDGDNVYIDNARIRSLTAVNIATNSLDATVINVASIFAQNAAIAGQLTVGASILIDGPNGRILVSD
ncbi:phage tail protein [Devosia sp.]|uniref:phage tail protein n=1 Tax=Devosia sp. TaxID=1871048 RepID=UPI001B1B90CF|nr:phage tail protein [Devosia sp.]MBO9589059.1 hypothetical protein [Devosia sp.]